MKARTLATLSLLALFAAASFARNTAKQVIVGTIESVSPDSVTLEPARGFLPMVTVLLLPSTKFLEDGTEISRKELKIGTRVVVNAKADANMLEAVRIVVEKQPARGNTGTAPRRAPSYNADRRIGNDWRLES